MCAAGKLFKSGNGLVGSQLRLQARPPVEGWTHHCKPKDADCLPHPVI